MPDLDTLIAYEAGELDDNDTLGFFQDLVDSGMAWKLQGSYGRTASQMIEVGLINEPTN